MTSFMEFMQLSSMRLIGCWGQAVGKMTILKMKVYILKSKSDISSGKYSKSINILRSVKCYSEMRI